MKKRIFRIFFLPVFAIFLFCCGIPFSFSIPEETIEIPGSNHGYAEIAIDIPEDVEEDVKDERFIVDQVIIDYTVRTDGTYNAELKLYASTDQVPESTPDPDDELLLHEMVGTGETEISGNTSSVTILEALNSGLDKFVIGGENLSSSPSGIIYVDMQVMFLGTISPF